MSVVANLPITAVEGHYQEFEGEVDKFIQAGKGERLPFNPSGTSLEVSTPKAFVQAVASETRASAARFGIQVCCRIPAHQLETFIEFSLNRAIIYSAKLLSFYFRQHGATELYNAVLMVVF